MVTHARLPSLEDLPPQRRSTTVAALRRGQIKISEPVPVENSGPSPVWKSPNSSTYLNDSVTGFERVPSSQQHVFTDVNDHSLYSESQHMPSSADSRTDPYNPPRTSHGQPLRHKRSSLLIRDSKESALPGSGSSSQPRSSTNDSVTDSSMNPQDRKKRRSGSIRLAFRKIFNKKDKILPSPSSPGRPIGRGHEYHKSVSTLAAIPSYTGSH
jgi:hypothetical protein